MPCGTIQTLLDRSLQCIRLHGSLIDATVYGGKASAVQFVPRQLCSYVRTSRHQPCFHLLHSLQDSFVCIKLVPSLHCIYLFLQQHYLRS